ncbi:hypothetical protein K438DRAFT_1985779 [Mycena galopus ATCC 62051]|nr:hypothetical protein K438DRAFT_1985779 [Mycena galopus ATCC 62051]
MSGDEGETEYASFNTRVSSDLLAVKHLDEAWKILWGKFPGFHELLLVLSNQPATRRALTTGLEGVRSDDTATLKRKIPLWLNKDKSPLDPPLASLGTKSHCGFAHPVFAKLLTPMEWPATESTWADILNGTKHVTSVHLPAFLFPLDQEVTMMMCCLAIWCITAGAIPTIMHMKTLRAILMGPEAALEGDGYHKGRPGNASIIGLTTFSPRVIAWVVVQYKSEGKHFDYEVFFWTICDLFDDDEWGGDIISLWNRVVLGATRFLRPQTPPAVPATLNWSKRPVLASVQRLHRLLLLPPLLNLSSLYTMLFSRPYVY